MKPWQESYEVEQTAMDIPDGLERVTRRSLRRCGEMAPVDLTLCLRPFPGLTSFCERLQGHPGGHRSKPDTCNRPAGHEGHHAFYNLRDANKLGEW